MSSDPGMYDLLASTLIYPRGDFESSLNDRERISGAFAPALRRRFAEWVERIGGLSSEDRAEAYARSFDLSPKCTLELGWHLFGESYDRGTFLVWMRSRLRLISLDEATDLPDHARHVLPVLGRMESDEADKFSRACVLPAMETIRAGLEDLDSPYISLIDAICGWLEARHGASDRDSTSLPILTEQHEELLSAEEL